MPWAVGHADFFPNGGFASQPGCINESLSRNNLIGIVGEFDFYFFQGDFCILYYMIKPQFPLHFSWLCMFSSHKEREWLKISTNTVLQTQFALNYKTSSSPQTFEDMTHDKFKIHKLN